MTWPRTFPDRPEMHVSHETIYQSLFVQGRGHLRADLHKHLRTGRAIRRHRGEPRRASWSKIRDMILISERPAEADDRAVPGHWEGDLIVGINARSAIGTLVERTTRYVMLLHLPNGHSADAVRDAMIPTIKTLPEHLRRSLTWDQGTELARHKDITLATDLAIYFCDPHKPWQRGSNENTNGLLRQYFPKSTDLTHPQPGTAPRSRHRTQRPTPQNPGLPHPGRSIRTATSRTRNNHPLQRPLETTILYRTVLLAGATMSRARASTASRTAHSRSSSGDFLGAPLTLILPWIESLHQTRGGTWTCAPWSAAWRAIAASSV